MTSKFFEKAITSSARKRVRIIFVGIILLVLVVGAIDGGSYYNRFIEKYNLKLPHVKEVPFRLGLDLQGGTHLVYKAHVEDIDAKDRDAAVEGVRDVIERRVNVFGVSEPLVTTNETIDGEYQVIVELAGVKDVRAAIEMIGETPLLEFKEQSGETRQLTTEEAKQISDYNTSAQTKAEEVLGKLIKGGDFSALAAEYSEDEATKDKGGEMEWISWPENPALFDLAEKLGIGGVSRDLATSSDGYELIKVEDKRVLTDLFSNKEDIEVEASHILVCYEGKEGCATGLTQEEAWKKINDLKKEATPRNFTELAKANSDDPSVSENEGYLGWFSRGMMATSFEDAVYAQGVGTISDPIETEYGYHLVYKVNERTNYEYKLSHILVRTLSKADIIGDGGQDWKNTELTGKNLKRASVQFNSNDNSPEVLLQFDEEGAQMFTDITERNVGQQVAIFLDGYVISAPRVNERISGGQAVISGKFSLEEAKLLAQRLNAGALPVPIEIVSQKTIGASLGAKSIQESKEAAYLGLILVALFMVIYYRLPGILAVISLGIYGLLVLAIFKFFEVTLTLSGLAGFILSIGMAVDANVLIFERIKEELRSGSPLAKAIEDGFRRAWPSIRDGNISTILTCVILIIFTTSVIKGFAVTLVIGILVSMFSAIIITKNLLNLIESKWLENKLWLMGVRKNKVYSDSKSTDK